MARTEVGSDGWAVERHGVWGSGGSSRRWERETLGPVPAAEPCAQLGEEDYEARAKAECRRFIEFIRIHLGPEPAGVVLRTRSHRHDFGFYYEVEVAWEEGNEAAEAYALRAQSDLPETWGPSDKICSCRDPEEGPVDGVCARCGGSL